MSKPMNRTGAQYNGHRTVNYMKGKHKFEEMRFQNYHRYDKEQQRDFRFWMWFHADWHETVIMTKTHPTTEMKSMDWGHLNELDVQVVTQAVDTCQNMHLQAIMSFNCHWNEEVVTQFYATLYVDHPGKKFHWMLQGEKYSVTYRQFADMLGFPDADLERPKIHDENVIDDAEMHFMYDEAYGDVKFGETSGLIPYYKFMNQILRYTPRPETQTGSPICQGTCWPR
jgi:hypothetical protein